MKKILLSSVALIFAFAFLFAPSVAKAETSRVHFNEYDVNIIVRENNVLDITEKIHAYFAPDSYQHGIIREIPAALDFYDGKKYIKYDTVISDIQVPGHKIKVYRSGEYQNIRIGDINRYASGDVYYTISYRYDIGDDKIPDLDFLYFNIIGPEWNADIDKATYTVTMPKAFDASKVWAYEGAYGETRNTKFTVDGNVIMGKTGPLTPHEGITLKVDLPEGYFVGERTMPPYELILYILIGALILASIILFIAFGIDRKPVPTVEFYPPDKLTSADIGYIVDGCVDNKDMVSLIIYWADKGYLQIIEKGKDNIELKKLKDLDSDANKYEATFFYGLFKGGDQVSISSLKNTFYTTMEASKTELSTSFNKPERRVFTAVSLKMQGLMTFFTALPFALTVFFAIYKDMLEIVTPLIMAVITLFITLPAVYSTANLLRAWRSTPREKRAGKLIWRLILIALVFFFYWFIMSSAFELERIAWVGIIATLVIAWFSVFMRKRTPQGTEWMGKIIGLQNFIEKAEKDRIEMLVQENPSYFYNILPFAYVLGVTERWAKKFEGIGLHPEPPTWYTGYSGMHMFTSIMFMNSMNHSLNTMSTTMVSKPAPKGGYSGGGGGFGGGGGGFSGGGFGGGGGGGW